jgi:hypothetical protein
MSLSIQSVLIPKNTFTLEDAQEWILNNGFKLSFDKKNVDITDNYFRFRQSRPSNFKKYFTREIKDGVLLVIGNKK